MTIRFVVALTAMLLAATAVHAEPPRRVVTVNLCLDQLALRLAAPGQLVGVSYLARNPAISVLADRANDIATVRGTAESILDLRPDLVIFDSTMHTTIKQLVRTAGVPILELHWAGTIEESETLIERMAEALGRSEQGRKLVASMRARQQELSRPGPPTATAAVLQANLRTTGKGTLMDELLGMTGYRNLAAELGISAYGRTSLEAVLAGQPDVVIFDGESNVHPSRGTSFVDHPAIRTLAVRARILSLPIRYSICAGPENFEAMQRLREAHP